VPKMKTHKATAKRFKLSKTGKVMHLRGGSKGGRTHFRRRRSKSVLRGFDKAVVLETKGDIKKVKTLAPYLKKKKRS
jgi:large subunit ribosomal protein L35